MNFFGKRILITHTIARNIMGSTVVALELGEQLIKRGAIVDFYAYATGAPMIDKFKHIGVRIVTGEQQYELEPAFYDFIWVQGQVLPLGFLTKLKATPIEQLPIFIFHHMSPLKEAADERPYIYGVENNLSSLSLFISGNTRDAITPYLDKEVKTELFRNPAPIAYCESKPTKPESELPKNILIVSNHAPQEVLNACESLRNNYGIAIDHIGFRGGMPALLDPATLVAHDCVITIGKTVQYCLVSGTPVYVYDKWGGYGYLNDDIYASAAEWNFAARNGRKMLADEIASDIIGGFVIASRWQESNRNRFIEEYSLDKALDRVFEQASRNSRTIISAFSDEEILAAESAFVFSMRHWELWKHRDDTTEQIKTIRRNYEQSAEQVKQIEQGLRNATREIERLRSDNKKLRIALEKAEKATSDLKSSRSYQLGRHVSLPYRKARKIIKSLKKRN